MKKDHSNKRVSDTVLYSYLICALCTAGSYFIFEGKFFELTLQISILAFLLICTVTALKISSIDNFYFPPVEIPVSNKRWQKCIEWWSNLSDDELMLNIRKLKAINQKNADTLLRAFEHSELFEKCSIIKRAIN